MGLLMKAIVGCILAWLVLRFTSEDPFKPEEMVYGKNMIITGASSGIGKETAILACEMGANVFITARRENLLIEVLKECNEVGRKGAKHGYVAADMGDMEQAKSVVLKAAKHLGSIDYLILNHAYEGALGPFVYEDENFEDMRKLFDINFFSMVKMTIAAMPFLQKSQGKVATVSSIGGEHAGYMTGPYAATKFSMGGFFTTLEHENYIKETNVSFTLFCPGAIDTGLLGRLKSILMKEQGIDVDNSPVASMMAGASSRDCAYDLIRTTALRQTRAYFPNTISLKLPVYLAKIFPEAYKNLLKSLFS